MVAVPMNKASCHNPARKTRIRALEKQPSRLIRMRMAGLKKVDRNTPDTLPARKEEK